MIVKAFKGIRPKKEYVEQLNAPPYDVVEREEVEAAIRNNPLSFYNVIRAEASLKGVDEYSEEVYLTAKRNFEKFLKDGILFEEDAPSFYIYAQTRNSKTQFGFYTSVSCDDYEEGRIKINEHTIPEKEDDRAKLLLVTGVHTGPVFMCFRDDTEYDKKIEGIVSVPPEYDFKDENGVIHRLWVVKDPDSVKDFTEYFAGISAFYICDGHHRSASSVKARNILKSQNKTHNGTEDYNFFSAVVFPSSQLEILAYNRLVKDLNGLTSDEFIKKLEDNFIVEKCDKTSPDHKGEIIAYIDKTLYSILRKRDVVDNSNPVASLDVSVLQDKILSPILGIDNPRVSKRVKFVGGIKGAEELIRQVDGGNFAVAFSMYPVSIEELMEVSDRGMVMPPKSTWFEPKLRSGLVSQRV